MRIKEIIVVEGKADTVAIKRAVQADTIETNGSAVNNETIERIRLAQEKRGVIIFTDPDYPGERIRHIVSQRVPGCKHAFLSKEEALAKRDKGVGIEHASDESIRRALQEVKQEMEDYEGEVSMADLLEAGLLGGSKAQQRRDALGKLLKIGRTNGKQLHKRLQMFQIPKQAFEAALMQVLQEEQK
ncbi:ribonuclease M5 [Ectobacillus ponti]|uniref:Ribonuclease M5 n=1 Tax=Ectobacillus ponti TaxID=2961894 RepID=A0AA41XFJ6_9BACI|nr:ribonuclease M5 [Ectobacillus ponti]MCP8971191.1 ribonuclease M5 [Ectobacillus ponti]